MGNKPIVHAPIATGSTESRDIRDRFADIPNVLDFGAKGDGITDDSAAFTAAKTSYPNTPIFVPRRTYRINSNISGKFFSLGTPTIMGNGKITDLVNIYPTTTYGIPAYSQRTSNTYRLNVADHELFKVSGGSETTPYEIIFTGSLKEAIKTIYIRVSFSGEYGLGVIWPSNVFWDSDFMCETLYACDVYFSFTTVDQGMTWIGKRLYIEHESDTTREYNEFKFSVVKGTEYACVPINLKGDMDITNSLITIDWGDGTIETKRSSNFSSVTDYSSVIHQYTPTKIGYNLKEFEGHTIKVICSSYAVPLTAFHLISYTPAGSSTTINFADTVRAVHALPLIYQTRINSGGDTSGTPSEPSFQKLFYNCSNLNFVSTRMSRGSDLSYMFAGTGITSIPSSIFDGNYATNVSHMFENCNSLVNFEIDIYASTIISAANFVTPVTGAQRIIHVRDNTNTASSFDAVASSLGLTVIHDL